jgi:hypothetical protein
LEIFLNFSFLSVLGIEVRASIVNSQRPRM